MNEWTEDNRLYNLVPDRLDKLVNNWNICTSTAKTGFVKYKNQDRLSAAELGLEFLGESFEEAVNNTITELQLSMLDQSREQNEEGPPVQHIPAEFVPVTTITSAQIPPVAKTSAQIPPVAITLAQTSPMAITLAQTSSVVITSDQTSPVAIIPAQTVVVTMT